MKVEANARLLVNGDFYCTCNANTTPRLLTNNDGVVIVTGTATVAGKNNGGNGQNTSLLANSSSAGIVLANKFSFTYGKSGTNWHHYNIDKIGVGTGGITYNNSARNYPMEFYCTGDWTFNDLSSGGNGVAYDRPSISFHTSDYLTPATGRTITANACFNNKGVSGQRPVIVDGCGKMIFNCDFYRFYGLVAKDTVTVEINNNCKPCHETSTNITMKSGTTLSFPKAGTGTTKELCPIVIESGAKMSFSNLSSSVVPVSAKGLTLPESSSVPLTISGSVLADGVYSLISLTSGTIPDSYTNFVVSGTALGTKTSRLFRSSDKQMLLLAVDVPAETDACIWTGEGDGESFSHAGNWMNGDVPSNGGETIFFPSASGAIVNDIAGFAPASITFLAGSAAVTISGDEAISGITAITNLSAASHTINAPVYFTSGINVKQNAVGYNTIGNSHVTLAGGAYAAAGKTIDSDYSVAVFGRYYFANTTAWTATEDDTNGKRKAVAAGSYLYVPLAGNMNNLFVSSGATIDIGNVTHSDANNRISWRNYGEMIVTNLTFTGSGDRFVTSHQTDGIGTFKFEAVTCSMSGGWFYLGDATEAGNHVFYIGAGGMKFANASGTSRFAIGRNYAGNTETVRPWHSDFTIADRSDGDYSLVLVRNVIFCTDDENGDGRTITIDARTRSANSGVAVTVSGSGKVKLNNTYYNGIATDSPPTVTVTDTATLAIKPGAGLGESAMTVNTGATLEVPESGTAALTGSLALADGSALAFKVGENDNAVLGLQPQTLTLPESGKVTVKLTADSLPAVGRAYTLTSGAGLADASMFELAEGVGGSLSVSGGELVYTAPAYFYIKISESDAGGFNINPAWFWAHGGLEFADTEKLAADIAQPAPNGYTYLQNYLLGYEPDDPASKLSIDDGGDGGASGSFTLDCTFNVPDVTPESGNYVVKAKLLSSADGQNFSAVEGVDEKTVSTRGSEEIVSFAFTPDFTGGGMFRFFA